MSRPVVVLAGGTGGAKLARGMADVVGPERLSVVVNTGFSERNASNGTMPKSSSTGA